MEQMFGIKRYDGIDSVKKPRQVAFLIKRRADIRHDEIADEKDVMLGVMNEHAVDRFSTRNRDKFKVCPAHDYLGMPANRDIGLEISNKFLLEISAKKVIVWKISTAFTDDVQFLAEIVPGVELDRRAQMTKITMSSNMVPVPFWPRWRQRRPRRPARQPPRRSAGYVARTCRRIRRPSMFTCIRSAMTATRPC